MRRLLPFVLAVLVCLVAGDARGDEDDYCAQLRQQMDRLQRLGEQDAWQTLNAQHREEWDHVRQSEYRAAVRWEHLQQAILNHERTMRRKAADTVRAIEYHRAMQWERLLQETYMPRK
jgi:hypothetical protein